MSESPSAPKKQDLLQRTDASRRQLMKMVLGVTTFSVPLMASFSLSGMRIDAAHADPGPPFGSNQTLPFGPDQASGASIDVETIDPLRIKGRGHSGMKWSYAAKFLCGEITGLTDAGPLFVPGFYRTDLEILNTANRPVSLEFTAGVAGGTTPTPLDGNRILRTLQKDEGLQFDCLDILNFLGVVIAKDKFAKGWVVVRSQSKVHVTAIHMLATEKPDVE